MDLAWRQLFNIVFSRPG